MANVYAVILAGGSGTRFWPASRKALPKQLLALGPGRGALLKQTLDRLKPLCSPEHVLIATGLHVLPQTRAVLPELGEQAFLGEPVAKNTAPCIGWAVERIERTDPEAVVIVVPSDQYIRDEPAYLEALRLAVKSAEGGVITTLGIKPTRPDTAYGYIETGASVTEGVLTVARFVEKPNLETAQGYLKAGNYYWNAGMFIFQAKTMLAEMRRCMPTLHAGLMELRRASATDQEGAAVERFFEDAQKVSIDYGVMEKAQQLNVIPADIGWSDLGSFQVAWELSQKDSAGNVAPEGAVILDSQDNLLMDLRTERSLGTGIGARTLAVVGISGMCVIQTDDALLVIPRDRCQEAKDVVELLQRQGRGELT